MPMAERQADHNHGGEYRSPASATMQLLLQTCLPGIRYGYGPLKLVSSRVNQLGAVHAAAVPTTVHPAPRAKPKTARRTGMASTHLHHPFRFTFRPETLALKRIKYRSMTPDRRLSAFPLSLPFLQTSTKKHLSGRKQLTQASAAATLCPELSPNSSKTLVSFLIPIPSFIEEEKTSGGLDGRIIVSSHEDLTSTIKLITYYLPHLS